MARERGQTRFVGYSGDNASARYAVDCGRFDVLQTSLSVADHEALTLTLPAARAAGLGVIAKRPIANAAWKEPSQQPGMYKSYARPYTERLEKMDLEPTDLGLKPQAWLEMALRFTLSFPEVHTAIIGTTNPKNAEENIRIAEKGPLPPDAVAKIRAAFKHADPVGAWPGLT